MGKNSALYQLMDTRMNGVMNNITNRDGEYQEIIRRSDVYFGRLEQMVKQKCDCPLYFLDIYHSNS